MFVCRNHFGYCLPATLNYWFIETIVIAGFRSLVLLTSAINGLILFFCPNWRCVRVVFVFFFFQILKKLKPNEADVLKITYPFNWIIHCTNSIGFSEVVNFRLMILVNSMTQSSTHTQRSDWLIFRRNSIKPSSSIYGMRTKTIDISMIPITKSIN